MDFTKIEKKWQEKWKNERLYSFDTKHLDKKYYVLEMFSYPSGAKLHLGHWWNFGLTDSFARLKRMQGYNVFHPMGFDSFGLPAENYAIKTGIHPKDSTYKNIAVMEEQLKNMGATFDWDYTLRTSDPEYYKWTQWLFLELFKNGLAYQKYAPVNWCTSCNTVLANEQVINGHCERCDSVVIKKNLTQWFFKITDYAEELLSGLNRIDWPEKTKVLQTNWIGKSVGSEVVFKTETGKEIRTFTSRIDTLFGVTWVVLAPEHEMVKGLTKKEHAKAVEAYIIEASKKDDIERQSTTAEKTGVFTGSYVINPINNEKVPVYVADYVLNSYGTGAVMGVAAHDTRDYDFAVKYNIPIKRVIKGENGNDDLPFTEYGILVNSGEFNGLTSEDARQAITKKLENKNLGNLKTNYRLRDWSVSRQRYWGCPIPIIHCPKCGAVAVPEKDLPVMLPYDVDWSPTGRSPLSKNDEYMHTTCPKCGGEAHRDPDTLDTFTCSSWYYLRYPNARNNKVAFDKEFTNKLLPVDKYVGGVEHATGHLLYSRFITKFLHDKGYLNFDEPFTSLVHQGVILGPDGNKMSKSKGNTVSPDEYIKEYGSDALRLYLMFGFNYIDGGPWTHDGIKAISKFMDRVERIVDIVKDLNNNVSTFGSDEKELDYVRNNTINEVNKNFENFGFNTSVARIMELVNAMYNYNKGEDLNAKFFKEVTLDLIRLLAPCAPHFSEELWQIMGNKESVFKEKYPTADESKLIRNEVEIVIQINSKIIEKQVLASDLEDSEVEKLALQNERVLEKLQGRKPIKVVVIKNRLINLIVK
ncbi:MAG: leucine--tRNA ligase [Spirochaetales bacterium]